MGGSIQILRRLGKIYKWGWKKRLKQMKRSICLYWERGGTRWEWSLKKRAIGTSRGEIATFEAQKRSQEMNGNDTMHHDEWSTSSWSERSADLQHFGTIAVTCFKQKWSAILFTKLARSEMTLFARKWSARWHMRPWKFLKTLAISPRGARKIAECFQCIHREPRSPIKAFQIIFFYNYLCKYLFLYSRASTDPSVLSKRGLLSQIHKSLQNPR